MTHSHDSNPYSQSCQTPTTASAYTFISSFLGALCSISLPTHITGYFLPTLPQTILLWSIVGSGLVYSSLTASLFFKIFETAISESYDTKRIIVEFPRKKETEKEAEKERNGKKRRLRMLSWASVMCLFLLVATSIGLFLLGSRMDSKDWLEFCTTRSLIVSAPTQSHDSSSSESLNNNNKLELCTLMALNQTYLILGIPFILLIIEVMRHLQTLSFIEMAFDQGVEVVEVAPRLRGSTHQDVRSAGRKKDGGVRKGQQREERELARSRRERRRRFRDEGSSEGESELDRLLSV